MTGPVLLADVGGTFTRLALAENGTIGGASTVESELFGSFEEAALGFIQEVGQFPTKIAIAAAGPVVKNQITLTNGPRWHIDAADVSTAIGGVPVIMVNDFAGLAAGVPYLPADGLSDVAPGQADPDGAIAVIGPGTGLGVALLAPDGEGGWRVLPGEGGHASLSPTNDREIAVLFQLIRRFGHVKAEHVLSGTGLEILWETLAELDGTNRAIKPTAGEIAERARRATCETSKEAVAMFTAWLGGFAGDVALIAGATGGVFLAGGVLPRWGSMFDTASFRRRFVAKGVHRPLMEAMPVKLITDKQAAFKGLLSLLRA